MEMELFALLNKLHKKEDDSSALIARNRAIDVGCAKRAISALLLIWAELEAHYKDVVNAVRKLLSR